MYELMLQIQLCSTLAMVGVIWFVQVVHYPLFSKVGNSTFSSYETSHQRRTTLVVAPLMLAEVASAAAIVWLRPTGMSALLALVGVGLLLLVWSSTYFLQVPAHEKLSHAFEKQTHQQLVRSNWIRTIGWSLRGLVVCLLAYLG